MGIIMESKADAMRKSGVGGNVSVSVAAPAEPAVESESAAVDSQEDFPADATEAAVSGSSEEVAVDAAPAVEEAPVDEPMPERKKAVRGARNVRKKR